jgi:PAS domain S-box-containing protein
MSFHFHLLLRQMIFALCAIVYLAVTLAAQAAAAEPTKRVLIISTGTRLAPGFRIVDQQLLEAFARIPTARIEAYAENLDLVRFPSERFQRIFTEYLAGKYTENPPDLVIFVFIGNLGAAAELLPRLFTGIPIIVAGLTEEEIRPDQIGGGPLSGVAQRINPGANFDLILRLQPEARRIVVIGGTAEVDRQALARVREAAASFKERIAIDFWDNRSIAELRQAVAGLPRDTVILYSRMFKDGAGQAVISSQVGESIAQWANVPVYGMSDSIVGTGAVGGAVASIEAFSKRAGELASLVLTGSDIKSLPFEIRTDSVPMFDWRALQRWGISEGRLPPGSVVRHKPISLWQQYHWYIVGGLIVFGLQSAVIAGFLVQRRQRRRAEAELRDSQQVVELAASAGELGLWSRDVATDRLWVNPPLRYMFGFSPEVEILFDDMFARIHPDDRSRVRADIERTRLSGLPFDGEFRVVCPDGSERWLLAKGRDVTAAGDRRVRRMGVVLDITERKRSEAKFRDAVEASPNAILMSDAQGRILLVNAEAEKLFGYTRQELLGQPVEHLLPERFRAGHPVHRETFQAAPEARPMAGGCELFGRRKDGREIPIEIGLSPIHSAEGSITLATIVDISERRRAAEALEKERKFLRQVIDVDPNFIFAKDRAGRFTLANQAVADAFGTTVDNLIGKTDADFNPNRDETEHFRRVDLEVIDTLQEHFIAEERITDAGGNVRWLQSVKRPIVLENGSGTQVLGASTDITRRKKTELELQEQRDELAHVARVSTMGELAASLAHELNQPLTAILSNAQAALRFISGNNPAVMEEVREILQDIVDDNNRAGEVIRRMRALVKKGELEMAPLDLASLIRDVVFLVHSDAILQNIKISYELADDLPPVRGDKVQLQQVVLNLILNAFDAMKDCPAGERQVTLRLEASGTALIQAAVIDRGTGLSGDKLDKIFQPFYTTKGEGLGMGLSICRSIIEAHGGHLWAENNPDRGATFYFTLPLVASDEWRGTSGE